MKCTTWAGGRANSISILETIELLASFGYRLQYTYRNENRAGDHICYISGLTKLQTHFPNFRLSYPIARILEDILRRYREN